MSEAHFGFRNHHSTESFILKLLDNIYKNTDQGSLTEVESLHLKKAFDTVDHYILFKKLTKFGLADCAVDWFKEYLLDHKQSVRLLDVKYSKQTIACSVLQGSILGLLLIIFINALEEHLQESDICIC